jgi:peptide/nickel transport system substrate-binding protein
MGRRRTARSGRPIPAILRALDGQPDKRACIRIGGLEGGTGASVCSVMRAAVAHQEGNGTTLIVGLDGTPSDLDPHSQYDYRSTPAQMTTPDEATIIFDCGTPQPLFLTAMAATCGPQIVNVNAVMGHEEDGDFGNTWLQLNAEGTGTGGWKLVSFEPGQETILERNENYWRGWEGNHFERIIIRVVEEVSTMRQLVESGDVDIIDRFSVSYDENDDLKQVPTLTVDLSDSTEVEYFTMTEAGPLASPEARQAMCYAFPYQEVIDGVYSGYASRANSLIAPSVLGYQEDGFSSKPTSRRRKSC